MDLSIQARMPESEGQELPEPEGQELRAEKWAERVAGPLGRPRGENREANHRGMGGKLARERRTATNARERRESEERQLFVF